jgi:hypothetical protein
MTAPSRLGPIEPSRAEIDMSTTPHDLRFYVMTLPNVPWDELLAR